VHQIVERSLAALMGAETYSDVHYVITSTGIALGYDYFGYQYWPGGEEYGDRDFAGVVQCNYPETWMSRYVEQGFYDIDPVRLFGLTHEGVTEWRLLGGRDMSQEHFMREAAQYGLDHGVVGSFQDSEGGRLQIAGARGNADSRASDDRLPSQGVPAGKPHQVADRAPTRLILCPAQRRQTGEIRGPLVARFFEVGRCRMRDPSRPAVVPRLSPHRARGLPSGIPRRTRAA